MQCKMPTHAGRLACSKCGCACHPHDNDCQLCDWDLLPQAGAAVPRRGLVVTILCAGIAVALLETLMGASPRPSRRVKTP